jgi:hypothetical protein
MYASSTTICNINDFRYNNLSYAKSGDVVSSAVQGMFFVPTIRFQYGGAA